MYGYDIFHDKLMEGMISNVRKSNPPHAYIFEGEPGLGKLEAARLFAAALACTKDNQPCGTCNSCVSAKSSNNPDIVIVKPDGDRKTIGAERIRQLIGDAYTKPFLARRKIYIFPDAQIITEQAQNAFLKLLEEPPEYAVFIIVAGNSELLLQTVRSRCVTVRFSPVSDDKVREYVEKISPGNPKTDFIVRYSRGIPKNADSVINDEEFENLRALTAEKLKLLFSDRDIDAYNLCDFFEENKDSAPLVLSLLREFVRDIIMLQAGSSELLTNNDYREQLSEFASYLDERYVISAAEKIIKAEEMQRRYVSLHSLILWLGLSVKAERE